MKPLDLKEFAEELRRGGDMRESDFADEILALLDLEEEVAEPYSNLCADLEWDVPEAVKYKPEKALEYLRDRSNLLADIEKELAEDGRTGDTDDQVKAILGTLIRIRDMIGAPDTATDEDLETAIQVLADRAPLVEYDL